MIVNALFVGAGGFVGVLLRYLFSLIPVGNDMVFPIKTFVINMIYICAGNIRAYTFRKHHDRDCLCFT